MGRDPPVLFAAAEKPYSQRPLICGTLFDFISVISTEQPRSAPDDSA